MARENATEESRCDTETGAPGGIDVCCPNCGTQLAFGRSDPSCPGCEVSFFVRVFDEFALIERGGWTVAVSLGVTNGPEAVVDG